MMDITDVAKRSLMQQGAPTPAPDNLSVSLDKLLELHDALFAASEASSGIEIKAWSITQTKGEPYIAEHEAAHPHLVNASVLLRLALKEVTEARHRLRNPD